MSKKKNLKSLSLLALFNILNNIAALQFAHASPACPSDKICIKTNKKMELRWN